MAETTTIAVSRRVHARLCRLKFVLGKRTMNDVIDYLIEFFLSRNPEVRELFERLEKVVA